MSTSNHQLELPEIQVPQPAFLRPMVDFIDRFTAMVVDKLQVLEKSHGIGAPKALSR
jgi:hypothetical protein